MELLLVRLELLHLKLHLLLKLRVGGLAQKGREQIEQEKGSQDIEQGRFAENWSSALPAVPAEGTVKVVHILPIFRTTPGTLLPTVTIGGVDRPGFLICS